MDAGAAISRTDLHTHILPGVDDGAIDLAEATAMAKVALDDGIVCLAATPHSLRWPTGTVEADLISRVAALEHSLAAQALPLRVVIGAETALIPALPLQIDAGQVVTLNHSRYLLIEPVFGGLPAEAEDILLQVQARGLVPVLAHPERSPDVQRQPQRLSRLVEQGALVQITAGPIKETVRVIREVLQPWLGQPAYKATQQSVKLLYRYTPTSAPESPQRVKIEINTREHVAQTALLARPFTVASRWTQGSVPITSFALEELLGTKLRALYQRKKVLRVCCQATSLQRSMLMPNGAASTISTCIIHPWPEWAREYRATG